MTEIPIHPAPAYMHTYLDKLIKVTGHKKPVGIAVIAASDMPARAGVTDSPDGFLHIRPDHPPLIVLRDDVAPTLWQSIVAHEFLHALRWSIDKWVLERLPDDEHEPYMRLVEETMQPLTILLMVGGIINAEWVEEEPTR